jgi:hypothetical protein
VTMPDLPWSDAPPPGRRGRQAAAALLRAFSATLDQVAQRLLQAEAAPAAKELLLEFHAEAGAPEGALYVNGRLVGHLPGVSRL